MTSKVFTVSKYLNVYLLSVHRKVEKQELNHNAPGKHIFRAEHPMVPGLGRLRKKYCMRLSLAI